MSAMENLQPCLFNPENEIDSQHRPCDTMTPAHPYPENSKEALHLKKFRHLAKMKPKAMHILNR